MADEPHGLPTVACDRACVGRHGCLEERGAGVDEVTEPDGAEVL